MGCSTKYHIRQLLPNKRETLEAGSVYKEPPPRPLAPSVPSISFPPAEQQQVYNYKERKKTGVIGMQFNLTDLKSIVMKERR